MLDLKANMSKKILLFGGSGYSGTVLAHHLINHKYSVISFDNLIYNNYSGSVSLIGNSNYTFINGDTINAKINK